MVLSPPILKCRYAATSSRSWLEIGVSEASGWHLSTKAGFLTSGLREVSHSPAVPQVSGRLAPAEDLGTSM